MANPILILPLAVTSGSPAEITGGVPSGAMGVTVHADWWANAPSPVALDSLASNFAAAFTIAQTTTQGGPVYPAGNIVAWARVTSTGSEKTITPTFGWGVEEGPVFILVFWDGIPAAGDWVRLTGGDPAGSAPRNWTITASDSENVSGSIPSAATDVVVALDSCNGGTVPTNPTGWTSLATQSVSSRSARLRRANTPGGSSTSTETQLDNYASLGMIAIMSDGSGGGPAPVLELPTGAATGANSASGTVSTNKAGGSLRFLASTNASESAGTIKASGGTQAVSATGVQNVTRSGLASSTVHYLHYVQEHPDGDSNVVSSAPFTTDDAPGARDTPEILGGAPQFFDLGASASPAPVAIVVPANAEFAVFCVDLADYPEANTLTSLTTDFTGTPVFQGGAPQTAAALGQRVIVAPVTSTGSGKQITVAFAAANDFAPAGLHVYFLDKVDLTYPVRGLPGFASSSNGTASATASTGMAATDLVVVRDMRADNDSTFPALGTGFTNLATTRGAAGSVGAPPYAISHRVKRVTTPSAGTASATTQNTVASSVSIIAFRGALQVADETLPTLAGSITETDKTENSISISWPAGSDNVGIAGYDVSSNGGSSWTELGNVLAHDFEGLTAATEYQIRVRARDAAGNTSTPPLSTAITTTAPDTTDPTLTGSITVGTKTATSIAMSWPAGSDNVGVTSYEVSSNAGSSWTDVGNVLSHTFTGLAALTSFGLRVRAKDAAGRVSTPLAATTSTYRAGDTAANIRANTGPIGGAPAGALYEFADGKASGAWLSYRTVSGPTPSGGTLDAQPDGRFTYFGPDAAVWVIQPEMEGADEGEEITITLYDQGPGAWSDWASVGGSMSLPQLYNVLGSLPAGSYEVQIRAVRGGNNSAESDTKTVDL